MLAASRVWAVSVLCFSDTMCITLGHLVQVAVSLAQPAVFCLSDLLGQPTHDLCWEVLFGLDPGGYGFIKACP